MTRRFHLSPDVKSRLLAIAQSEEPAPEAASSEPAGEPFGRYLLIERIGEGGMGEVWRAFDRVLRREVALKRLRSDRLPAVARDRFVEEASTAARLRHPHIVTVHDVGVHEGRPYLTMDLIEGPSLAGRAPLDPREAARIVAEAARALHFAHRQGFVHRDVKPANLLLGEGGRTLVTDFGLATEAGASASREVAGTPEYMSPEQVLGHTAEVDARSDVYGLGATLYHLLTGRPPFAEGPSAAILDRVVREEPVPPRVVQPGLPRGLEATISRAMAKDRGARYPTAEALANDLEAWMRGEPVDAERPGVLSRAIHAVRRRRGRIALTLALLLAVGAGAVTAGGRWRSSGDTRVAEAETACARALSVSGLPRLEARRSLLEDAARAAEAAVEASPRSVAARRLLASVHLSLGAYERATSELEPLATEGDGPSRFELFRALYRLGLWKRTLRGERPAPGDVQRFASARQALASVGPELDAQVRAMQTSIEAGFDGDSTPPEAPTGALCPEACYAIGRLRAGTDDFRGAESFLRRALDVDPLFLEAGLWLCWLLIQEGKGPEALSIADRIERMGRPEAADLLDSIRSEAQVQQGDVRRVLARYEGRDPESLSTEEALQLANARLLTGDPDAAAAVCGAVRDRDWNEPIERVEARHILACAGSMRAQAMGDGEERRAALAAALDDLEESIRLASSEGLLLDKPAGGAEDTGFAQAWKRFPVAFGGFYTRRAIETEPYLAPLRELPRYQDEVPQLLKP